jgi:hypothetical protein
MKGLFKTGFGQWSASGRNEADRSRAKRRRRATDGSAARFARSTKARTNRPAVTVAGAIAKAAHSISGLLVRGGYNLIAKSELPMCQFKKLKPLTSTTVFLFGGSGCGNNITGLAFNILNGLHREPDSLRLFEQMVWPHITIDASDDCGSSLVAYEHGDFRIGKSALPRLRNEIRTQAVRRYMIQSECATNCPKANPDCRSSPMNF